MQMIDSDEIDDKIIAVAKYDMSVNHINDLSELPPHTVVEMRQFFEDYKKLQNKKVTVEHFLGKADAFRIIEEAVALYRQEFGQINTPAV